MQEKQERQFGSLDWKDSLEEEMATQLWYSWPIISWTEEPGRLQSMGSQSWTELNQPSMHAPGPIPATFFFFFTQSPLDLSFHSARPDMSWWWTLGREHFRKIPSPSCSGWKTPHERIKQTQTWGEETREPDAKPEESEQSSGHFYFQCLYVFIAVSLRAQLESSP